MGYLFYNLNKQIYLVRKWCYDNQRNNKFLCFLENLSTYNNFYIEEEDFLDKIKLLKKEYRNVNIEIPNEIKMTKSTYDFRSEMQKMGGYKERYK